MGPIARSYFNPTILSEIMETDDPGLYSKSIAIVFWDIS